MGVETNVGFAAWPKQGALLHRRARVCFHYDGSREVTGTIVRSDAEAPYRTIIALDDGRVVLASECMYSPFSQPPLVGAVREDVDPPVVSIRETSSSS